MVHGRVERDSVLRWCVQDEVNQEESEQEEVDGMKQEADSLIPYSETWYISTELFLFLLSSGALTCLIT